MADQNTTVEFGDWLPDDDRNIRPGTPTMWLAGSPVPLDSAKNLIFTGSAWRLYKPLAAATGTLATTPEDAITVDDSGTLETYVAGANGHLYQIKSGVVTDVSKAGAYTASQNWSFAQFGDCLIGTNGTDNVQDWNVGTSSAFADLAGTPPKGRCVGVVRDFVVLGYTSGYSYPDGSTGSSLRVHWSAIANPTSWPTPDTQGARAAQSGSQDCYAEYGDVLYIAAGEEVGMIFQQRGIVRMQYVGGDVVFEFYTFERKRGLLARRAAVQSGNTVFFLSTDGFYATDGSTVSPIGYGKVNRWFFANCADTSAVRAAVDTNAQCVYWSFPSVAGQPNDHQIIYNFGEDKWSYAVDATVCLFQSLASGNQLGAHIPQAFTTGNVLGAFSGAQADAEIQTKAFVLQPGTRALVTSAKVLADDVAQVAVAAQVSDDDPQVFSAFVARNARTRRSPLRANGTAHALDVKLGANTTYAQGVELEYTFRGAA